MYVLLPSSQEIVLFSAHGKGSQKSMSVWHKLSVHPGKQTHSKSCMRSTHVPFPQSIKLQMEIGDGLGVRSAEDEKRVGRKVSVGNVITTKLLLLSKKGREVTVVAEGERKLSVISVTDDGKNTMVSVEKTVVKTGVGVGVGEGIKILMDKVSSLEDIGMSTDLSVEEGVTIKKEEVVIDNTVVAEEIELNTSELIGLFSS